MRALVLEEIEKEMLVKQVPDPELTPTGVIVKVKANGICRSDWHAWVGDLYVPTYPWVLGHEFTGVIEEVGKDVKRCELLTT
jgi:D-arabinose 1-dehydrogenase-like Zn-dependent alcohol dehydrogenase